MHKLSFMSKLEERIVSCRLIQFLEGEKLLPKFQSGFRARHSTKTAILKILSNIMTAADLGTVSVCLLCQAIFDTVLAHACTVEFLKTVEDLGVTIDSQLSMKEHLQRVHCSILPSLAVEIDKALAVSRLLLNSESGLHHQQDRLLQH